MEDNSSETLIMPDTSSQQALDELQGESDNNYFGLFQFDMDINKINVTEKFKSEDSQNFLSGWNQGKNDKQSFISVYHQQDDLKLNKKSMVNYQHLLSDNSREKNQQNSPKDLKTQNL